MVYTFIFFLSFALARHAKYDTLLLVDLHLHIQTKSN